MSNRNLSVLCSANQNTYFDIDDILATQERVLCKFELPVLNMGMLTIEMLNFYRIDSTRYTVSLFIKYDLQFEKDLCMSTPFFLI
jgi:hypothetical protein